MFSEPPVKRRSRPFGRDAFNAPMLVHSTAAPGTAAVTRLKGQLHWERRTRPAVRELTSRPTTRPRWMRFMSFSDSRLKITGRAIALWFADADNTLEVHCRRSCLNREGRCVVGSSRVDLQACKLEYSIVSPK